MNSTPLNLKQFSYPNYDQDPRKRCEQTYRSFLEKLESQLLLAKETSTTIPSTPSEEIWDSISLENNLDSSSHINMNTPNEVYSNYKGYLLAYQDGHKKSFKKTTPTDLSEIDCIAMGGIDFYTMEHFGALRKYSKSFYTGLSKSPILDSRCLYYYPLHNKKDRYKELLKFHKERGNYVSQEMLEFTSNYIIPKILTGEELKIFCFSAACREALMIETVCKDYFSNYSSIAAHNHMSQVTVFLFGYAFDCLSDYGPHFKKLIVTSVEDFGVLRPEFNRTLLYGCSVFNSGISYVCSNSMYVNCLAIVFGADALPISLFGKLNTNGHHLGHYIEGFNKSHLLGDTMTI